MVGNQQIYQLIFDIIYLHFKVIDTDLAIGI